MSYSVLLFPETQQQHYIETTLNQMVTYCDRLDAAQARRTALETYTTRWAAERLLARNGGTVPGSDKDARQAVLVLADELMGEAARMPQADREVLYRLILTLKGPRGMRNTLRWAARLSETRHATGAGR